MAKSSPIEGIKAIPALQRDNPAQITRIVLCLSRLSQTIRECNCILAHQAAYHRFAYQHKGELIDSIYALVMPHFATPVSVETSLETACWKPVNL